MMRYLSYIQRQNLNTQELNDEKKKDYRNIVYLQVLIILSAMLLRETLAISGASIGFSNMLRDLLILTLGGLYVFVLWDLLRNLSLNNTLIMGLFALITVGMTVAFFTVNPFFELFDSNDSKRPYLFFVHLSLFTVETTVIYHCVNDIFTGKKLSAEKIWGAACIYLMIGLSFGSLYDLVNIVNPGSMGLNLSQGLDSYSICIYYSMTIIGGHDAILETSPLIQNLGIIEAVWSNLFIVLLVGRLLGKPDDDASEDAVKK
ncbi:hypothetical protein [Cytophaga aurantiaca]|uniref:hypothetical protein n=1 Tax=Cytophaga aurantiaca TaxID=29530 RepID=UPI00036D1616|nr:hypothetical protein [Cytophaga aurantiaca]